MLDLGFTSGAITEPAPPPPRNRNTLAGSADITGRGLHSGIVSTLSLQPASPGSGYCFRRTDLPGKPEIPVSYNHLALEELDRRTTLSTSEASVHTIEHVLSALVAAQIDDAIIEVDAAEPPFVDGSSLPFARMIEQIGKRSSVIPVEPIVINKPMAFLHGDSEVCAMPAAEFRVTFFFNSTHPNLRAQSHSEAVTSETYLTEIAPARTFCFFEEIELLRRAGLIRGANLASAVVIGRKGIINDSLRFSNEPVRHKILDFIGDLALLGRPLQGHFLAWRAGHRVNAAFGMYLKKELNL